MKNRSKIFRAEARDILQTVLSIPIALILAEVARENCGYKLVCVQIVCGQQNQRQASRNALLVLKCSANRYNAAGK
jgi:hypothetical protein